jgi:lipopolysaccharide cholinephosphotransferase
MYIEDDYRINHKTCLVLLEKFLEICDKNDIEYFFAEGSCLGAIRHQGFIPWDVNIDINLTLSEYKKLDEAMNRAKLDNCIWNNPEGSGRVINWLVSEKDIKNGKFPNLDFGLISGAPSGKIHQEIISFLLYFANKMYKLKVRNHNRKFPFNILKIIASVLPDSLYTGLIFYIGNKYPIEKCEYMVHVTPGAWREAKVLTKKTYFPGKHVTFEGKSVQVPGDYHNYLVQFYGKNYMTPVVWDKGTAHYSD